MEQWFTRYRTFFFITVKQKSSKFQFDSDKNDFEKYIEKLLRMKKAWDKKEKERWLRNIRSRFFMRKTLRF